MDNTSFHNKNRLYEICLSITTPVLAFAGVSVADSLSDLTKSSWKILIVAIFVFLGSYLGRVLFAQLGIMLSK